MVKDLYSELERIEDRGKRKNRKRNDDSVPEVGPQKPVKPNSDIQGNNGGTLQESRSYQRDIYAELERIEERGKKKKRSFFSRS